METDFEFEIDNPLDQDDIRKDLLVPETVEPECPTVAGWPDDDFAQWISVHRDETLGIICDQSEFGDLPFCDLQDMEPSEIE